MEIIECGEKNPKSGSSQTDALVQRGRPRGMRACLHDKNQNVGKKHPKRKKNPKSGRSQTDALVQRGRPCGMRACLHDKNLNVGKKIPKSGRSQTDALVQRGRPCGMRACGEKNSKERKVVLTLQNSMFFDDEGSRQIVLSSRAAGTSLLDERRGQFVCSSHAQKWKFEA